MVLQDSLRAESKIFLFFTEFCLGITDHLHSFSVKPIIIIINTLFILGKNYIK